MNGGKISFQWEQTDRQTDKRASGRKGDRHGGAARPALALRALTVTYNF